MRELIPGPRQASHESDGRHPVPANDGVGFMININKKPDNYTCFTVICNIFGFYLSRGILVVWQSAKAHEEKLGGDPGFYRRA